MSDPFLSCPEFKQFHRCSRMNAGGCPFSHGIDIVPRPTPDLERSAEMPKSKKPVCYDFLKGNCTRESCKFAHVKSKPTHQKPPYQKPKQTSKLCRHFQEHGTCSRAGCPYTHQKADSTKKYPVHPIKSFKSDITQQRVPLDVLFVLDISGSMSGSKITSAINGIKKIVSQLVDHDRFGLITFNSYISTVFHLSHVRTISNFDGMLSSIIPSSRTALWDAIAAGIAHLKSRGTPIKKNTELVILTDGDDTCSKNTKLEDLIPLVGKPGIPDFHLILIGVGIDPEHKAKLENLCEPQHCGYVDVRDSGEAIHIAIKKFIKKRIIKISLEGVCHDFLSGNCSRGDSCRLKHVEFEQRRKSSQKSPTPPPCRFFQQGHCIRGAECKFSHLSIASSSHS